MKRVSKSIFNIDIDLQLKIISSNLIQLAKVIIDHPLMKAVYAIVYDANKDRLYAVSGKHGKIRPLGFTFSAYPDTFGELIAIWELNDKFGEPHDLALIATVKHYYVGENHPIRIDSFEVLN